jgi:hypothetical protein
MNEFRPAGVGNVQVASFTTLHYMCEDRFLFKMTGRILAIGCVTLYPKCIKCTVIEAATLSPSDRGNIPSIGVGHVPNRIRTSSVVSR